METTFYGLLLLTLVTSIVLTVALWRSAQHVGKPWLLLIPVARERMLGKIADKYALPGKPTNKTASCTVWAVILWFPVVLLFLIALPALIDLVTAVEQTATPTVPPEDQHPFAGLFLILAGATALFLAVLLMKGVASILLLFHDIASPADGTTEATD